MNLFKIITEEVGYNIVPSATGRTTEKQRQYIIGTINN